MRTSSYTRPASPPTTPSRKKLTAALRAASLPGLTISETTFTPTTSVFEGQRCRGVSFTVTSARDVPSVRLGIELAVALRRLHPAEWKAASLTTLLGHEKALTAILAGEPADRVIATFERDTLAFAERRKAYLLY